VDPKDAALLASLGRSGWSVLSKQPSTEYTSGTYPGERIPKYPEGSEQWVITDGKGHNQTMVVKPSAPYPGPYSSTTNDPGSYNPNPTVIDPPKDLAQSSSAPQGWTDTQWYTNTDGSKTLYGRDPKTGLFGQVPGMPTQAAGPGATKPTPADKLEIVNDPTTGKPIKYRDPATGTVIDLPDATPQKSVLVDGQRGAKYSWDGTTLKEVLAGEAADVKPQEGNTRPNVKDGYAIQEVYRGGQWVTDSSVAPRPFDPKLVGQPQEGNTRPNVLQGQAIQEIFRGGQWTVDTSVPPRPYATQAPTTLNTGNQPYIVQQTPDQAQQGTVSTIPNPNTTDITARVGQLQDTARQKSAELNKQVQSGVKSPEAAAAEFDAWWSSNIDPYAQQLSRAQQQQDYDLQTKQREQQRLEQEAQRGAFSTAQQAGQDAVKNVVDTGPYRRVGPGYDAAMSNILGAFSSGKAPGPIDASGLSFTLPDLNEVARRGTAEALAHISPAAASIAGRPMPQIPQGFDVQGALNKSRYSITLPDGTRIDQQPSAPPPPPSGPAPAEPPPEMQYGNYMPSF
jgi:hypothetical protein